MKESIDFIKNYVTEDDYVVCATSGGVDSMTLLYLLTIIRKSININIICAHINHNLREESKEEFEFVKDYCAKNNIIFEGKIFEKNISGNLESEFRKRRYKFFDEIVNKYNAKCLFTAHHGDDLIETILMRMVRGSSIDGYSGFEKVTKRNNYYILRPLIFYTKQDIYSFAQEKGIEYREDTTNESDNYTRNRYRHTVLPFLKQEEPNIHKKFLKFSETLLKNSNYIDSVANKEFNKVFQNGNLDIDKFKSLDPVIQTKIIYNILEKIYGDDLLIVGNAHVDLIFGLISSNKSNSVVHLPNNVIVVKSYNELTFSYDDDVNDQYEIQIDEIVNLPNGKIIEKVDETNDASNYTIKLNSKEVTLPLYVRNRRDGDKIKLKGLNAYKKVSEIFINEKIKTSDRNSWPVVLDSKEEIVWLPGLKKSNLDKKNTEEYDIILRYY